MSETSVNISTMSEITGVEVHTLRYWEKEFSDYLKPLRTPGGQRRYRNEDIRMVLTIKTLLREHMYSIAGAKQQLRNGRR